MNSYEIAATVYEKTAAAQDTLVGKDALRNLLRSYGLQLFNETNDGLGFDDPKYLVRTWQDRLDAVAAGWCLDVGETSATTAFDAMVSDSWASWHWTMSWPPIRRVPTASWSLPAGPCPRMPRCPPPISRLPCTGPSMKIPR